MIYYNDVYIPALKRSLFIAKNEKGVCNIGIKGSLNAFVLSLKRAFPDEIKKSTSKLKAETKQVKEYFSGKRKSFNMKIVLRGTQFQTKAWLALAGVKYGEVISYSELAKRAGNQNAVRAAATCCATNPVPVVIPCHRVISKNGAIGGFGGGLPMKKYMLKMEGSLK